MLGLLTSEDSSDHSIKDKKGKQSHKDTKAQPEDDELLYGSSDFTVGMFGVSGVGNNDKDKSLEEEKP